MQRRQAGLGAFGEEVPEEQADDEVELVVRIGREEEREHAHQQHEHRERLEQRPDESADRAVIPHLEVGADQRPDEPRARAGSLAAARRVSDRSRRQRRAWFLRMHSSLPGVPGARRLISSHHLSAAAGLPPGGFLNHRQPAPRGDVRRIDRERGLIPASARLRSVRAAARPAPVRSTPPRDRGVQCFHSRERRRRVIQLALLRQAHAKLAIRRHLLRPQLNHAAKRGQCLLVPAGAMQLLAEQQMRQPVLRRALRGLEPHHRRTAPERVANDGAAGERGDHHREPGGKHRASDRAQSTAAAASAASTAAASARNTPQLARYTRCSAIGSPRSRMTSALDGNSRSRNHNRPKLWSGATVRRVHVEPDEQQPARPAPVNAARLGQTRWAISSETSTARSAPAASSGSGASPPSSTNANDHCGTIPSPCSIVVNTTRRTIDQHRRDPEQRDVQPEKPPLLFGAVTSDHPAVVGERHERKHRRDLLGRQRQQPEDDGRRQPPGSPLHDRRAR